MRGKIINLTLVTAVAVLLSGCSSTSPNRAAVSPREHPAWSRLQKGMTYSVVGRTLSPMDPEIQEDIATVLAEEREARKDYSAALADLRANGVAVNPALRSRYTIDRGDYVLEFENGKLMSWARR
jgi:hypothetical protein